MTEPEKLYVDEQIVRTLIATQFPQWKNLTIRAVASSGWDNKSFHLGEDMLVRMPSAKEYELQVEKEHKWLPYLAPHLSLAIPVPLAMGEPGEYYPLKWSVYKWLEGETLASAKITDLVSIARSLAHFLSAFQRIDAMGGPVAGLHSFYRGGDLKIYDEETRQAIAILQGDIDIHTVTEIWEKALETRWDKDPVWVHGDVSVGNLLVREGKLFAVIDFGQLAVGDPACDLAIAWTCFKGESRDAFKKHLQLDAGTWARGRAWTLWKALIVLSGFTNPNNIEALQSLRIIQDIIQDYKINS